MILVAHGDRGGTGDNSALARHAAELSRMLPVGRVEHALLNGSPGLEQVLARMDRGTRVHIYPMLMSDGYFTDTIIPARLAAAGRAGSANGSVVHPPFGLAPALAGLIARLAGEAAAQLGTGPHDTSVLLVGHGATNNPRARAAVELQAGNLRQLAAFAHVATGFLEEPPHLDDALARLDGPVAVVGMFAGDGLHAGEDVPATLQRASGIEAHYTSAIGAHPLACEIIAGAITGDRGVSAQSFLRCGVGSSSARNAASA